MERNSGLEAHEGIGSGAIPAAFEVEKQEPASRAQDHECIGAARFQFLEAAFLFCIFCYCYGLT